VIKVTEPGADKTVELISIWDEANPWVPEAKKFAKGLGDVKLSELAPIPQDYN